jgi:putative ABC transport system substrate-binding protein
VGTLLGGSAQSDKLIPHFKRGMKELGYVEGDNIEYIHRWTEGFIDRVPGLTKELTSQRVDVILVAGVTVARPVQEAAPATPVVMAGGFDPVANGLAESLSRPGRSVTGIVNLSDELAKKDLELIMELLPRARRIGVLSSNSAASAKVVVELRVAGKLLNIDIVASAVANPDEIVPAISRLGAADLHALLVLATPLFRGSARAAILEHGARLRVPVVYPDSEYVDGGGLMSYGPNVADIFYRAASYVNKILKGANPGDLPIEQPTKFELVINRKTAKALGLLIPQSVFLRADRVIE